MSNFLRYFVHITPPKHYLGTKRYGIAVEKKDDFLIHIR